MIKSLSRFAVVIFFAGFLAACGSKITQDNFNKINNGMAYEEVVKLLGEPQSSEGGGAFGITASTAVWKDEKNQISIVFLNEKVTSKTFGAVQAPPAK